MRQSLPQSLLGDIAAAFMLLSRIPVFYQFDDKSPPNFTLAQWAFPVVGLVLGAGGGSVLAAASLVLPPLACGALCVGVMAVTSGAMHEDGLGDMADGFGGGHTPADKIKIMHDSHIGAYGVLCLCITTITRIALFAAIIEAGLAFGTIIGLVAIIAGGARAQIPLILRFYPIAKGAKLAMLTGKPAALTIMLGWLIWLVPLGLILPPVYAIMAGLLSALVSLFIARLAVRQIGGLNGDVMGAMIIMAEIVITATIYASPISSILLGTL